MTIKWTMRLSVCSFQYLCRGLPKKEVILIDFSVVSNVSSWVLLCWLLLPNLVWYSSSLTRHAVFVTLIHLNSANKVESWNSLDGFEMRKGCEVICLPIPASKRDSWNMRRKKKENCIVISVDSIVFSEDNIITVQPGRNNKKVRPDTIKKGRSV